MVSDTIFISHMCSPCGKTFSMVPSSASSVEVKVKYQVHIFKINFHIGHYLRMVSDRAFIFHMCIPCDVVPRSRSSVKVIVKYHGHNFYKKTSDLPYFWLVNDCAFQIHICFSCGQTFSVVPRSKSRSNMKITLFKTWLLRGHSSFTNTSCFVYFQIVNMEIEQMDAM